MKKFKFKLEVVLTKVTKELEKLTLTLAGWQKALQQAERILKGYELILEGYVNQFKEKQKKTFIVEEFVLYQRFLAKVQVNISEQEEKIKQIKNKINEVRQMVLEKNKEKKMLEKLKENEYRAFQESMEKVERKFLDELATLNYNRKFR